MAPTISAGTTQRNSPETLELILQILREERNNHLAILAHLTSQQDRVAFRRTLGGYNRDIELVVQQRSPQLTSSNAIHAHETMYEEIQAPSQDESGISSCVTDSTISTSSPSAVDISGTEKNSNDDTMANRQADEETTSAEGSHAARSGIQDDFQQETRYIASDAASTEDLECISCKEHGLSANFAILPCGMAVCGECLQSVFQVALLGSSFLPPQCCGQLMYSYGVEKHLTPELIRHYHERKIEFDTADKTYCVSCGIFLHVEHIVASVGTCPECRTSTCTVCKSLSHIFECPEDSQIKLTKQLAELNNWTQCTSCNAIIDRIDGCNQMKCRCGYEFCYKCGKKFKTCGCRSRTELTERRIYSIGWHSLNCSGYSQSCERTYS